MADVCFCCEKDLGKERLYSFYNSAAIAYLLTSSSLNSEVLAGEATA